MKLKPLNVKPLITVAELADATGESVRSMANCLRTRGVQVTRGRCLFVTLVDLRENWPSLIESLELAESARGWSDVA